MQITKLEGKCTGKVKLTRANMPVTVRGTIGTTTPIEITVRMVCYIGKGVCNLKEMTASAASEDFTNAFENLHLQLDEEFQIAKVLMAFAEKMGESVAGIDIGKYIMKVIFKEKDVLQQVLEENVRDVVKDFIIGKTSKEWYCDDKPLTIF